HGRRSALHVVRLDAVRADRLADLQLGEAADHPRPEDEADDERRQRRHHRTEGDVLEDAHEAELGRERAQPLRQAKQHRASTGLRIHACASPTSPASAATTRSMRMKREPLIRIDAASGASPSAAISSSTARNARAPAKPAMVLALSAPVAQSDSMPRSCA